MPYDVAIVLGGGRDSNDRLNARTIDRLDKALELFQEKVFPRVILSGGVSFAAPAEITTSEASLMKQYLLAKEMPAEAILLEEKSADTLGNAFFSRQEFLEPNAWSSVLVITSAFHIPRSQYLFKKVLGSHYAVHFEASETVYPSEKAEQLRKLELHIRDVYSVWLDTIANGDSEAINKLLNERHPAYAPNADLTKEEFISLLYSDRAQTPVIE